MRFEVKGKYDYRSGHEDDLSFNAGQVIVVTEEVDEEWYQGEYTDNDGRLRQGMFPRNFVVASKHQNAAPAGGSPMVSKPEPVQQPAQAFSTLPPGSIQPEQAPSVPMSSPPATRSPATPGSSPHSDAPITPPQPNLRKRLTEEAAAVKPSSFRDRIAAFNKASDAPLAPRTMPKPASFVRKPFIPPPPSKSSYFVPPKPTAQAKTPSSDQSMNREPAEPSRPMHQEPQSEPEFGKDNFKERIMAIQKELHYTNQLPNRVPVRPEISRETDGVDIVLQPSEGGKQDDDAQIVTEETAGREILDIRKGSINESEMEAENTTDERADSEEEIDPEVARRLAIRERMAKMSGGMGMHLGTGLSPAYGRGKTPTKIPSQQPTSPPFERPDPVPVMPGLPTVKPKELEGSLPKRITDRTEWARVPQDEEAASSGDEASKSDGDQESCKPSVAKNDSAEIDTEPEPENEVPLTNPYEVVHEADFSTGNSDAESIASSTPEIQGQSLELRTSFTMNDQVQTAASPPVPIPRLPSTETVSKSWLPPPPPPPPAPPISALDPACPLELSPSNLSKETKADPNPDKSDPEYSPQALPAVSSPASPKPPTSRPPPPPPPLIMPSRAQSIPTKAPPIPTIPRNFEIADPSPDQFYADVLSSPIGSTSKHAEEPRSPYSPPSPTPPTFRGSIPERSSQDASRNRTSLEATRRELPYMAMKEENLHTGRQWWLQNDAPPDAFRNRNDLIYEVEDTTSTRRGNHVIVNRHVYILFSDYSQTQVTAQYDRDDPSRVTLSQRHMPPPPQPTKSDLEGRHEQIGHQVVALAQMKVGASVGDGSALALVHDVFSKLENCLPSAGVRSHGALVFSNFGNSSTRQFDEIRPGDVVAFRNAIFQVHGGLRGKSTLEVGKPDHVAIIQEWNGSKRKLKVLEQRQDNKRVSSNAYRLGDLRSGEVHVFRPMPRSWVDW